jgi:hypothetical protein
VSENQAAFRLTLRTHEADTARFEAAGMGPGDSYRALWLLALDFREAMRSAGEEHKERWALNYHQVLRTLLPFERPRLQAIKMEGDPNRPVLPPEDVAAAMANILTHEELRVLDVVAMKLVTGSPSPRQTSGATVDVTPKKPTTK